MSKLSKSFFIILSVFIFFGFSQENPDKKNQKNQKLIKAEISKKEVTTGEIFSYLITLEGKFENPKLQMPNLDDFDIVSTKKIKSFSQQKDNLKTSVKITYFLFCSKPGLFMIDPVKLVDEGKTYKGKSFMITVTGESLEKMKKLTPYIEGGAKI